MSKMLHVTQFASRRGNEVVDTRLHAALLEFSDVMLKSAESMLDAFKRSLRDLCDLADFIAHSFGHLLVSLLEVGRMKVLRNE